MKCKSSICKDLVNKIKSNFHLDNSLQIFKKSNSKALIMCIYLWYLHVFLKIK